MWGVRTSRLNAAEPTMVDGPSSPGSSPSFAEQRSPEPCHTTVKKPSQSKLGCRMRGGSRADGSQESSIVARRISGAEEPRAINVRFATVAFQTLVRICVFWPSTIRMTVLSCTKTKPASRETSRDANHRQVACKLEAAQEAGGSHLTRDVLDRRHKHIRDDCDSEKQVHESKKENHSPGLQVTIR